MGSSTQVPRRRQHIEMRTLALILLLSLLCGCYAQSSILKLSSILKGQRCRGRPCGPTAPVILPGRPLTPPAGQRCHRWDRKCWEMSGRNATCKYCPSDVPICTGFCDSRKKSCDGLCRAATEVGEKNFTLVHSEGNGKKTIRSVPYGSGIGAYKGKFSTEPFTGENKKRISMLTFWEQSLYQNGESKVSISKWRWRTKYTQVWRILIKLCKKLSNRQGAFNSKRPRKYSSHSTNKSLC